ncbi:hypothetical protein VSVS12_01133 [Vibrio scophthalmi]|uniref:WYL domain-containing protein n=1 Tax=Vibrio scophthalmi TaxID=45658 RepID=UPI000809388F|nr:WYL domain-containing protein [Vibrio scophthalmi]ANS84900.1 hypothetical protein VSVS12_01133 [Vibrio scophthalmi]
MITFEQLLKEKSNTADRLAFVDFTLHYTGVVRRTDIGEMFNIGTAAASKVLKEYSELCPDNMKYDPKTRLNTIVRENFQPLINMDAETSLGMLANGFNKNKLFTQPKTIITFEKIGKVPNQLSVDCIAKISRAIQGKYAIQCTYRSENSDDRDRRTILPLTIMYDGTNWMFRGYDRKINEENVHFKSFHFSRCRELIECNDINKFKQQEHEALDQDLSWTTQVPLELELHPNLSEKDKTSVRTDFGMGDEDEKITIPTRETFIWILKKKWYIDTRSLDEIDEDNKKALETNCKKPFYKFRLNNLDTLNYYSSLIVASRR